jgi:hypothetical protein
MLSNYDRTFVPAFRAVMTAVFVGIGVAFISLIFNIVYRSAGADFSNDLLNVSCLIFGNLLLFLMIGLIYMLLILFTSKADSIFIALFIVLMILGWMAISSGHFAKAPVENERFQGMLKGLVLLAGIAAIGAIPLLYHSRRFEKYVV